MSKKIMPDIAFLCVAFLIVFAIVIFSSGKEDDEVVSTPIPPSETSSTPASPTTPTSSGYTAAEVAIHKNASSCWTIVNNFVYDVTSFISQHPGGSARILSICGIDGTNAFDDQHGGQRRPEQELASFKIGILKK